MANGNLRSPSNARASIDVGAVVFAETKKTFTARDFAEFLQMGGINVQEEEAGEILSEIVEWNGLREIGPGVYAAAAPRGGGEHPGGARIGGRP